MFLVLSHMCFVTVLSNRAVIPLNLSHTPRCKLLETRHQGTDSQSHSAAASGIIDFQKFSELLAGVM